MKRKEFLERIGIGAAFALTATCLGSCSKDNINYLPPPGDIDFTIDLTQSAYATLATNGNYVIKDKVVIAKDVDGNFVAATQLCSHEGKYEIILKDNEWFCTDHDARFSLSGNGLNDKGNKNLTIYQTELNGDLLRIFS